MLAVRRMRPSYAPHRARAQREPLPTFLREPRPWPDYRRGRRRPVRHLDLFGGGSRVRIPAALDGAVLVPAHDGGAAHVRPPGARDRARPRRRRSAGGMRRGCSGAPCTLLVVANVINIAADLGGMAEATAMVTGAPVALMVPVYGVVIVSLLMWSSYRSIARVFKWLTLVLLAYVAHGLRGARRLADRPPGDASFHTWNGRGPSSPSWWRSSARRSPRICSSGRRRRKSKKSAPRAATWRRRGATREELDTCRTDVATGMFASNAIMYFIIMTTAATLHAHGKTNIATAQQAAEALRPLAGAGAYWLFTLGLIGTGMLAVPVLAGSCAYAIAEASAWRGSLDRRPGRAKKFYFVLAVAMALGIALNYAGPERDQAALHHRGDQRRPRASAHSDRAAADRRSNGHGRRRQLPDPRAPRLARLRRHGRGRARAPLRLLTPVGGRGGTVFAHYATAAGTRHLIITTFTRSFTTRHETAA